MPIKRITIKEIAQKAGVSIGTVDRVLHNRGEVAAKTKELVLKIAEEGKYTANVYARNLKLNKIYRIAILLPKDNEYWTSLNHAIELTAEKYAALGIRPEFFTFDRHKVASLNTQAEMVLQSKPDGVILAPLIEEKIQELSNNLEAHGIPYVFVDSNLETANPLTFIGQNSFQAGYLAAKLLNFGYPKGLDAYITRFFEFDSMNKTIEERINGFKHFYKDHDIDPKRVIDMDLSSQNVLNLEKAQQLSNGNPLLFFVPNSRAHQLAKQLQYLDGQHRIVGFDLIQENKDCLRDNTVDFIIDQNPKSQGELALQAFYNQLIVGEKVLPTQFMTLEIFTKENLMG
nr:LacI family DNA-binding transcriptional regulator [Allomuricauda sp.]